MDLNFAWLTQKTEDPKSNKGNLTFLTHTHSKYDYFTGFSLLSSKKIGTPPPSSNYALFIWSYIVRTNSKPLILSLRSLLWYKNQSIDLQSRFLYHTNLRYERVNDFIFYAKWLVLNPQNQSIIFSYVLTNEK